MTYEEAERIILTLNMNFSAFLPRDVHEAAAKRSMWLGELAGMDFKAALGAAKKIIQTSPYPPTIYDFRMAMGISPDDPELTLDDKLARLPGPTWESEEGMRALYTADMERVDRMMAELDKELARMPGFEKERK